MRKRSVILSWLLLLLALLLYPGDVVAQTPCALHVNASDGSDTNPGSQTLPLRSLDRALSRLADGEAVCVAAGEYFRDDDADGISIVGAGRHLTLVLNSFAGEDIVRVSSREFLMDLENGSITLRTGTSNQIVFGAGVLNQGVQSGMQSVRLLNGTLDIETGVQLSIEGTVGRASHTDARIEFGNGGFNGTPVFSPAPRRIVVINTTPTTHTVIPSPGVGGIFLHQSTAPASILPDYDLRGTTFVSTSSSRLTYAGTVTLEPSSFVFESGSANARLEFASLLQLTGQAAAWSLDVDELSIGELHASTAGAWSVALAARDGMIGDVSTTGDAELNLQLSGMFTLGKEQPVSSTSWSGGLHVLTGEVAAHGDMTISGSTPFQIDAPASLVMNGGQLIPTNTNAVLTVAGSLISSSSAPALRIGATSTVELAGTLSGLYVDNAEATLNGSGLLSSIVTLQNEAHMVISGTLGGHSYFDLLNSVLEFNPGSSLETNSFNSANSTISLPADSRLQISGSAAFDSDTQFTTAMGEIVLGSEVTRFEEYTESKLPLMVSYAESLDLTTAGNIVGISVLAGRSRVATGGAPLHMDSLSVRNSTLSVNTQGALLLLYSGLEAEDATIDFESTGRLETSGVVQVRSSVITWPPSGLAAGTFGVLEVQNSDPMVLPDLILDHESGIVLITTDVTIQNDLHLGRGRVILDSGSTLTLLGSLSRSDGRFEPIDGGLLRFSGTQSERTITGFTTSVLPSIQIEDAGVVLNENGTILGGLHVLSGSFTLEESRSLSVAADVALDGGHVQLDRGSQMFASSDFFLRSGSMSVEGALVRVGQHFLVSAEVTVTGIPDEIRIGSSSASSMTLGQPFRTRDFVADGFEPVTVSGSVVRVGRTLRFTADTRVVLQSNVTLDGESLTPVAFNAGFMSGDGRLVFTGPLAEGAQHRMSGTGTWGHVELDLLDPNSVVLAEPGTEPIKLAGDMTFTVGGLDVNGRPVLLSATPGAARPLLSIRLTKSPGTTATRDGRGFVTSSGVVQILTQSRYDLAYLGEVQTLVDPGNEFRPGLVQSLDIDIRDAVNTPAVFGVKLTQSLELSGQLHIGSESLVRLEGADIVLAGTHGSHTIAGRLAGPGRLLLTAAGTRVVGELGRPSRLGRVLVDVQSGLEEVSLVDMASADVVTIAGGNVGLQGSNSTLSLRILEMTSGRLRVAQDVRIVTAGHLSIFGGHIQMDVDSRISLQDKVPVSLDSAVKWSVLAPHPGNGYVELLGSHSVAFGTDIPRLRLAPPPGELHSITALSDIVITDHLHQQGGQINLGSRRLRLDNATWTIGQFANAEFAVIGDAATQQAEVEFAAAVELELHNELRIFAARLTARSTTLRLTQLDGAAASRNLSVQGGQVVLMSGSVHLGTSDLVISSSQTDALRLGSDLVVVDGSGHDVDRSRSEGLFDDRLFGEIVVSGSGTTNIVVESSAVVSSMRVTGTVQILAESGDIQILNRLVFGARGSTLLTTRAGQIVLADHAILLRRGKGSLSHRPTFTDRIHLAYDLDDGSWTGIDTGFLDGTLTTGIELPGRVQSLDVLSGNRGVTINELRLGAPLVVTDRLSVMSGRFDSSTPGRAVTLLDSAQLRLGGIDQEAPATWIHGGITVYEGSLSLAVHSFRSFDFTSSLVPLTVPLDTVQLSLLTSTTTLRLARELSARVISLDGVDLSNRFRLSGHNVHADSSLIVRNISVESAEVAAFVSEGALSVHNGAVRENVRLVASGDLLLEAEVSNLEVVAGGNVQVDERRFSPQKLSLEGAGGEWVLKDNVQLGSLTLNLPEGSHFTLRTLSSQPPAVVLRVAGSLSLTSGVLSARNVVTEIAAPRPGFVRQNGHISGPVRQHVSAGESGTIPFPVGSLQAYTPMSVTPRSALITDATFTVSARFSSTHDRNGLPVTGPDNRILVDARREIWSLTSSINFAQSQPVTISVAVPGSPSGDASSFQLMRRQPTHAAPWQSIPGSPVSTATSIGLVVQHVEATGILTTSGVEFGMGSGVQFTEQTAAFQVVNLTDRTTLVDTGESQFSLAPGEASAYWAGGLPSGSDSLYWTTSVGEEDGVSLPVFESAGMAGLGILLPEDHMGADPTPLIARWASNLGSSGLDISIVHAWREGPPMSLELSGGTTPFMAELEPGGNTGLIPMTVAEVSLSASFGPPENRTELYRGELSPVDRSTAVVVLEDRALLVARSGSVVPMAVVTGIADSANPDAPGAELPTEYRLGQNYPNPFNPSTVIPFDLPEPAAVRLTVVDLLGRVVARQDAGTFPAGRHTSLRFSGDGLASGTYLYVVEAADAGRGAGATWRATGRMILLR